MMARKRQRGLVVARMSKLRGDAAESIGLARRAEEVARWISAMDLDLVGRAEDTDVSGSTDPFGRPQLGKWLTDRAADFDVIVADDLDRIGRNARHLTHLRDWCDDTGHRMIVLHPHLEWPPESDDMASPIMWDLLGRLAEYELASITKRNRGTREWLTVNGYLVGRAMYGYRVTAGETRKGTLKTLEIDPVTGPVVRRMVDAYLAGESLDEIARWANAEAIPAPNEPTAKHPDPKWHPHAVGRVIGSMSIAGRRDQTYTDDDGNKATRVIKYPGIISVAEHKAIVARLSTKAHRRGVKSGNKQMLTGSIFCGYCGTAMSPISTNGYRYYYDRNKDCPAGSPRQMIPLMDANLAAMQAVLTLLKDQPVMRTEIIHGHDYEDEIDQLKLDLAALDAEADDYLERVTVTQAEIKRLRSLPIEPPREIQVPTGEFIADVFADADDDARRGMLVRTGVGFVATRKDDGGYDLRMTVA